MSNAQTKETPQNNTELKEHLNPKNYPYHVQYDLQYSDIDRQGHVNNVAYLRIVEDVRSKMLYNIKAPEERNTMNVVAHLSADYLAETNWPGAVDVYKRVKRIGNSSFILEAIIGQHGQMAFHNETVMVIVNPESRKSTPIPPVMRKHLEAWLPKSSIKE